MQLHEIVAQNPPAAGKRILNYIAELGSTTNVNVSAWDINKIFPGEGPIGLESSFNKINKQFFAKIKELALEKSQAKLTVTIPPENMKLLTDMFTVHGNGTLRQLTSDIDRLQRKIEEYSRNITSSTKALTDSYNKLESIKVDPNPKILKVQEILDLNFFTLHKVTFDRTYSDSCCIELLTPPIRMKWLRKADNVEFDVSFGQYRVLFYPMTQHLMIKTHKNNIFHRSYPHPFVSTEGYVCFGTAAQTYSNHMAQENWREGFRLLMALLITYSPDANPYRSLEHFTAGVDRYGNQVNFKTETDESGKKILTVKENGVTDGSTQEEQEEEPVCGECDDSGCHECDPDNTQEWMDDEPRDRDF